MPDDRKPGDKSPMSEAELLRLRALADKRNSALETMSNTIRKQDEARRNLIDKMR